MDKIVVVINPTDTETAQIADVKFIPGPQGERGYSVMGTEFVEIDENGDYVYNLVFEDGSTAEFTAPKGPQGEQGIKGDDSVYVGPDPAPVGTTVQIDPNGDPIDLPAMIADAIKIYMRVNGGYIQYSGDGETWENLIAVADLKGDKGDPGENGADGNDGAAGQDGHSPVVTASKSGTVTTVYVDGTSIATINDGTNGTTPVKGTDYWTAQDQADIVDDVLAALPTWTSGGSY